MAKTQVTEEDIAQGIQSLGGFGNLAQKPRRDSPFGSDFAQRKLEPKPLPQTTAAPSPILPVVERAAPVSELTTNSQKSVKNIEVGLSIVEEIPQPARRAEVVKNNAPKREPPESPNNPEEREGTTEAFTERITLQMTADMRDTLSGLARSLQRSRREKGGRITANMLMRVAIQNFIDGFDQKALSGVSSEQELLREVQSKRRPSAK